MHSVCSRSLSSPSAWRWRQPIRNFSSAVGKIKRFYKSAHVTKAGADRFEVNLDSRKLRTPCGSVFHAPNEALALAVANEWNSQKSVIDRTRMHLTSLCNTAIDNPLGLTPDQQAKASLEYLRTDTVLYWCGEQEELLTLQQNQWHPIIQYAASQYSVHLRPTSNLAEVAGIDEAAVELFGARLRSYNSWGLVGIRYCCESLKSFLLTLCIIDRRLSVERACQLSRLETEFQADRWGQVEWHHGVEQAETGSRTAAGALLALASHDRRSLARK